MKKVLVLLTTGAVLSGCAAQLSDADRDLLNKAVESGRSGSQTLQAAESAAVRAEQAAAQSESSAKEAEASASQAASQAGQAQQNALKAEKAFEMKIKK